MQTSCVQRGKMGSTEYFLGKMPAGQLIDTVGLAAEMPEWEGMTADEKMQREPDINRVCNEIVPYFTNDTDRFFGCVVVDIYQGFDDVIYEPITNIVKDLPAAYQVPLKDVGFLTFPGKERLIALDGQHRILAIKIAIKGNTAIPVGLLKGKKPTAQMMELQPHPDLANEEISAIFVKHTDTTKIRKIFNKINKYARQTGRGDNIITSDDDVFAIISRRLFAEDGVLQKVNDIDLVNWKSNTLSQRSKQITTVSALYTIAEILLKDRGFSTKVLPSEDEINEGIKENEAFWKALLEGIDVYRKYMDLTKLDKPVSSLRNESLLMKPVTQMSLAHVAFMANQKDVPWPEVVEKLNRVDWSFDNSLWFNLLTIGSAQKKMITGKESVRAAGMVISYLVMGKVMTHSEVESVREIIRNARNNEDDSLPEMI